MAWSNKAKKHLATSTRNRIIKRDGHQCRQCGSTQTLEIDHINNTRDENYNHDTNLQVLCKVCHASKTAWESRAWRRKTKRKPRAPIGLAE